MMGYFHRCLDTLRATTDERNVIQIAGRDRRDPICQIECRLVGKVCRESKGKRFRLLSDRLCNTLAAVPYNYVEDAGSSVYEAIAVLIIEIDSVATNHHGKVTAHVIVKQGVLLS